MTDRIPMSEIDVTLLRELMEAGNALAEAVDDLRERSLDSLASRTDAQALARWEAALIAIGKAVLEP
jgi:hypothetical protein